MMLNPQQTAAAAAGYLSAGLMAAGFPTPAGAPAPGGAGNPVRTLLPHPNTTSVAMEVRKPDSTDTYYSVTNVCVFFSPLYYSAQTYDDDGTEYTEKEIVSTTLVLLSLSTASLGIILIVTALVLPSNTTNTKNIYCVIEICRNALISTKLM